jgi:hypothetical protein
MQAYIEEENQYNKDQDDINDMHNQKKFFEDIDSTKKNDDQKGEQFVYNLRIDSFDICKKCDIRRETFKFNNFFHRHIRECKSNLKDLKLEHANISNDANISLIKSKAIDITKFDFAFRSYQYVTL